MHQGGLEGMDALGQEPCGVREHRRAPAQELLYGQRGDVRHHRERQIRKDDESICGGHERQRPQGKRIQYGRIYVQRYLA